MIIISHRGNVSGRNKDLENEPKHCHRLLHSKRQVEVDVWYYNNSWYLGHDSPHYEIDLDFITLPGLWLHAKNLDAAAALRCLGVNYFCHSDDDYAVTSMGYLWVHQKFNITECSNHALSLSVVVLPLNVDKSVLNKCYGICVDDLNQF